MDLRGDAAFFIEGLSDYENASFSAPEKAALPLADQMLMTNPDGELSKALYGDLTP